MMMDEDNQSILNERIYLQSPNKTDIWEIIWVQFVENVGFDLAIERGTKGLALPALIFRNWNCYYLNESI